MSSRIRPPRPWRIALCALLIGLVPARALAAEVAVALELLLAVDCSSSVDADEYRLQMHGLAAAFRDPRVQEAIVRNGPDGIAVAVLQWAGAYGQERAIGWTRLRDAAEARAFAARIEAAPRLAIGGPTAIGPALVEAADWIESNGFAGARRVIDLSGDGRANEGASPIFARGAVLAAGLVINGLAILNEERNLAGYYAAAVIGGPGAFVLTAEDYGDFEQAIRRKLLLEIGALPVADAGPVDATVRVALNRARGR